MLTVLLLLFLLCLTYVSADIKVHRIREDDNISIIIGLLFGLIKLKFNIPYIDMVLGKDLKPGLKIRARVGTKKKKKLIQSKEQFSFNRMVKDFQKFKEIAAQYESVLNYILRKTIIDYFKWHTRLGIEDAALTAVVSGLLWGIKSNLVCIVSEYTKLKKVDVNIYPIYSEPVFESEIHCIIRIKIANIIIAGLKIVYIISTKVLLRRGGGNERTSYSGADENYNG